MSLDSHYATSILQPMADSVVVVGNPQSQPDVLYNISFFIPTLPLALLHAQESARIAHAAVRSFDALTRLFVLDEVQLGLLPPFSSFSRLSYHIGSGAECRDACTWDGAAGCCSDGSCAR